MDYRPHQLQWSDEKVSRFWEFYNNYEPFAGTWFTEIAGPTLLNIVNKTVPIKGRVLDYGTGQGFLLEHLVRMYPDIELHACDFTPALVKQANEKFARFPQFKGCLQIERLPSNYSANHFDIVFLIETVEHLTDNYLNATFQEVGRILKPGGVLVVTTPNEEVLEKHHVHCVDCGATFHHMQHVRSWNKHRLAEITKRFGLSPVYNDAVNLEWHKQRGMVSGLFNRVRRMVFKGTHPNLIYIGRKN